MTDEVYTTDDPPRRYRPARRVEQPADEQPALLTEDLQGVSAAYGEALLFIGYEVEGSIEIVVYPRYRFSSDDRVQGYLGYLWVQPGTPWGAILPSVDAIVQLAQSNYRTAVSLRASELRAHGSRFEQAYNAVTDIFRESWHGFALRLGRYGSVTREGATFTGRPLGPVLVTWRDATYTLMVFDTGSICLVTGDQRRRFQ